MTQSVDDFDRVREELNGQLDVDAHLKWLSVSFTKDRKWAL
ncbi:putative Co/Zn/Cd cation transporter (cation efflux family) [Geomicrobium halophilum]|uniref:Putative Co/Zn/Cd cation transporter (Cation efflux family) n=1 Tax=Geomicrobium halophilum TaxID=549000 RepID=A0A841Q0S9_9BACL|nr:hypothetical protein [Geomicrobium halophilum]MBB6449158.1 putative Co/Zn/Cd cation transporter (cation efflux family) [Geomicrobium halophilum]